MHIMTYAPPTLNTTKTHACTHTSCMKDTVNMLLYLNLYWTVTMRFGYQEVFTSDFTWQCGRTCSRLSTVVVRTSSSTVYQIPPWSFVDCYSKRVFLWLYKHVLILPPSFTEIVTITCWNTGFTLHLLSNDYTCIYQLQHVWPVNINFVWPVNIADLFPVL